jgi:hypothetical protein
LFVNIDKSSISKVAKKGNHRLLCGWHWWGIGTPVVW